MQVTLDPPPSLPHTALPESVTAVEFKSSSSFGNSVLLGKTSSPVSPPPFDQRSSADSGLSPTSRTQPAISSKSRSSGSSKETVAVSLAGGTTRAPRPDSPRTSKSTRLDFGPTHHRKTSVGDVWKRSHSPNMPSPLQRSIELERVESSRSATRRSSVKKATSTSVKSPADTSILRRRASIIEGLSPKSVPDAPIGRGPEPRETISASRPNIKKSSLEIDFSVLSISGSNAPESPINAHCGISDSNSGSGSSDNTTSSDGGFTDYLSDESPSELQRQAVAKAALLAETHASEQEFRAARQQLAGVNLRPPKSWGPGMARFR
jgi:hypothetical protein